MDEGWFKGTLTRYGIPGWVIVATVAVFTFIDYYDKTQRLVELVKTVVTWFSPGSGAHMPTIPSWAVSLGGLFLGFGLVINAGRRSAAERQQSFRGPTAVVRPRQHHAGWLVAVGLFLVLACDLLFRRCDRHISHGQEVLLREQIVRCLTVPNRSLYISHNGNAESDTYANEFARMFKDAGWPPTEYGPASQDENIPKGLRIIGGGGWFTRDFSQSMKTAEIAFSKQMDEGLSECYLRIDVGNDPTWPW